MFICGLANHSACGIWPAFWSANLNNWPNGGEIDILEGVNEQTVNKFTLHTAEGCTVTGESQSGYEASTDCYTYATEQPSNEGCGGWAASTSTYGNGMNSNGGGVYAMDWRIEGIRIWYFAPNAIPSDIKSGNPTTSGWGTVLSSLELPLTFSRWPIFRILPAIFLIISTIINLFLISRITFVSSLITDFAGIGLAAYTLHGDVREIAQLKSHIIPRRSHQRILGSKA